MTLKQKKWKVTQEDFEARKEKAIQLIKDVEFIAPPKKPVSFTEKELREDFTFEDMDEVYEKYDYMFFDGNFVIEIYNKIIFI